MIFFFLLFKKCPKISNYYISNLSTINFFFFSNFFLFFSLFLFQTMSKYLQLICLWFLFFFFSNIKGFLILLCVFALLSFFALPYMVCLDMFVLKSLTVSSLKPPTLFLIGSWIQLINQSYEALLIGLLHFFF